MPNANQRKKGRVRMWGVGELKDLWERETRTELEHVDSAMEFPFSIFIYEAPLRLGGKARWNEVLRAYSQQWAIYAAGLLHNAGVPHQDAVRERPVIKAVRYGITFLALPSEEAVELVERVIAKQRDHPDEPKRPFW